MSAATGAEPPPATTLPPTSPTPSQPGATAGGTWSAENSGTADPLLGVWGARANEVWAVGTHVILRSAGDGVWSTVGGGTTDQYTTVFGDDSAVFVAGMSCDDGLCDGGVLLRSTDGGASWSRQTLPGVAWGFSRGTDGTVYLAIDGAVLSSRDGFQTFATHAVGSLPASHGVLASDDGSGLLMAFGGLRSFEIRQSDDAGTNWDVAFSGSGGSRSGHVDAAWAHGAQVWAVANAANVPNTFSALLRSDDGGRHFGAAVTLPVATANGVWGSGADDVYVAGTQLLHASDGATFTPVAAPGTAEWHAVWGSGPNDVYAVGLNGAIAHLH